MPRNEPCPRCRSNGRDRSGDNLNAFKNGHYHCFACGYHTSPKWLLPSLSNPRKPNHAIKNLCPSDVSEIIPATANLWLLQYALPRDYWDGKIGYSAREQRLIFYVGNPIHFSIGRYVGPAAPAVRKWWTWGDPNKFCEFLHVGSEPPQGIILVEDWISANVVSQALPEYGVIPLFGTATHSPHIKFLSRMKLPIFLWLDFDQTAVIHKKAVDISISTGCPIQIITHKKDPKCLSREEISTLVERSQS